MLCTDRLRAAVLCTTSAAFMTVLLAACGGGEQVERFSPQRIIAFGDESSLIVDSGDHNGRKYTVNGFDTATPPALDCRLNPIWIQSLANAYGLVFPQCNPDGVAAPASQIHAQPNATVAMVKAQIDAFFAQPDTFNGKDLATVMVGTQDVRAAYDKVVATPAVFTEAQATAAVEQAGSDVAAQVNRIAQAGAKVLVVTLINLGTTPWGVSQGAAEAALLSRLTASFNTKLRIGLLNDGHLIGLVLADETFSSIVQSTGGFANLTASACGDTAQLVSDTSQLLNCTPATLVTGATATTWLWAGPWHLGPGGQATLGSLAVTRATGNPF